MFKIGLTGGIASGKSLVAHVLRDLGTHVIDADRIVHELLEPDQGAWKEVLDHFGDCILLSHGVIDRRKLGEIVFNSAEQRQWLNACLHPKVFTVYTSQVKLITDRSPDAMVVLDAALLIETGYHRQMDRLVVVYAKPEQQIERLMVRDCFTRDQALSRIGSQMPLSDKLGYAHYVINNTGTREDTVLQTHELHTKLVSDARSV